MKSKSTKSNYPRGLFPPPSPHKDGGLRSNVEVGALFGPPSGLSSYGIPVREEGKCQEVAANHFFAKAHKNLAQIEVYFHPYLTGTFLF